MANIDVVDSEDLISSVNSFAFLRGRRLCRKSSIRNGAPSCISVKHSWKSRVLVKSNKAEILLIKWPTMGFLI